MAIYQKKPVHVQAWQWTPGNKDESRAMLHRLQEANVIHHISGDGRALETNSVKITTLEGIMTASPGDWIIKGIEGEFYPCKPSIFEATYELVDAD